MKLRTRLALFLTLSAAVASQAAAAPIKVIVNNSVRVQSVAKKTVSDIFLKKVAAWEGGDAVVPVDNASATVRDEFCRSVHGRAAAAVKSYWNQQIFSGRGQPPLEKISDAEVLAFVKSTPGAVGYVSGDFAAEGVRVVAVQ